MSDIKAEFIRLIRDNWNNAATNWNNAPEVTSGWLENDHFDVPTVQLIGPFERVLDGGETGYSAIQSGSGRPISRMIGDIYAICTTHELMGLSEGPEYVARQMRDEVRRIVSEKYLEPFEGLHWISFFNSQQVEDSTRRPIWFRYDCNLKYCYDYRV